MKPFVAFDSTYLRLELDHVDTDQIIPARFLKTTSREGLGVHAFADWRYDAAGNPKPDFVMNRPGAAASRVLLAGENFGCGSSREHAPWALVDCGLTAVIARSFGDIFRQNALKNGLLTIAVDADVYARLRGAPLEATVRIELGELVLPDGARTSYLLDPFRKACPRAASTSWSTCSGTRQRSPPTRIAPELGMSELARNPAALCVAVIDPCIGDQPSRMQRDPRVVAPTPAPKLPPTTWAFAFGRSWGHGVPPERVARLRDRRKTPQSMHDGRAHRRHDRGAHQAAHQTGRPSIVSWNPHRA